MYSLIAIMPQCVHDLNLMQNVFTFLDKLYARESLAMRRYIIDSGMVPSIAKSVTKFFTTWGSTNAQALSSIQNLIVTISYKSLTSNGNISVSGTEFSFSFVFQHSIRTQVVWDMLNCLSFMEESKTSTIHRCLRSNQAVILSKLMESFFPAERLSSITKYKFTG